MDIYGDYLVQNSFVLVEYDFKFVQVILKFLSLVE